MQQVFFKYQITWHEIILDKQWNLQYSLKFTLKKIHHTKTFQSLTERIFYEFLSNEVDSRLCFYSFYLSPQKD